MAFAIDNLQRIGGSVKGQTEDFGAPTIWSYKTNDAVSAVDAAGYFDNGATTNTGARNLLSVGDFIFVHGTQDTVPTFGLLAVNANASGIVDTTNTLLGTTIDSD